MTQHDFEGALELINAYEMTHHNIETLYQDYGKEIQLALHIADRLQKGEMSAGMLESAQKNTEIGAYVCENWSSAYECIEDIFKEMSQELIKECEDE